ncbi:MAG: YdcH family protein [Nitratireductor sp.]|nr:YdcH family protein [Nitratireductor sp.]
MQRPCPDSIRLSQLKRKKLRLRDEIADLEAAISGQAPHNHPRSRHGALQS